MITPLHLIVKENHIVAVSTASAISNIDAEEDDTESRVCFIKKEISY